MNYFNHFYTCAKDLLRREEEADAIMKAAEAINLIDPGKFSEAEIIMFIQDLFDNLLSGTGYEYNYPGYYAVYYLLKCLHNLDERVCVPRSSNIINFTDFRGEIRGNTK